jgi:hypothetical protein
MNEDPDRGAQAGSSGSGFRTIFDGFEGYQVPSNDEADLALRSGVVVVDTNALLNLYRYNERTRDDLFRVLESLGTRLWVPHQVMLEPNHLDGLLGQLRRLHTAHWAGR